MLSIEAEIVGKDCGEGYSESNFAMFDCFYEHAQQEEVTSYIDARRDSFTDYTQVYSYIDYRV